MTRLMESVQKYWRSYKENVPLLAIIVHYLIALHFGSDCDHHNGLVGLYIVSMCIFTFGGHWLFEWYVNKKVDHLNIVKDGLLKTFVFFSFSYIRAKPYKCLEMYSPWSAFIVFVLTFIVVALASVKKPNNEEIILVEPPSAELGEISLEEP